MILRVAFVGGTRLNSLLLNGFLINTSSPLGMIVADPCARISCSVDQRHWPSSGV